MTEPGALGREIVANMRAITKARIEQLGLDNARASLPLIRKGKTIRELRGRPIGKGDCALVVAAGPSVKRQQPARLIRASGYEGAVVAADGGLRHCLVNGVIPDLVVTTDPNHTRIVRWFGDPSLTAERIRSDDYFRRQDMDTDFADELKTNREQLALIDEFGPRLKIALCSSSPPAVVNRVHEAGLDVYWWNPMYDDPDEPDSVTRRLFEENGLPCVNAGGNVGSACWMMAAEVLSKKHVGLCGIDFGYYADTPYVNTQYYHEAVALVGEANLDSIYVRLFNPHEQAWYYADPAYLWYRECLLQMVADSDALTYNCSGGGILFGDEIRYLPLAKFLSDVAGARRAAATD